MRNNLLYILVVSVLLCSCSSRPDIKLQRRDLIDAVFASGKAVSENQYNITAFAEGYLNASLVSEGDSVKKGQALFKLVNDVQQTQVQNALINYQFAQSNVSENSPQILQLQEQINQAIRKKEVDSVNYVRYQNLLKTNAVAKSDYDKVFLDYQSDLSNVTVLQKSLADLKHNLSLNEANTKAQYLIQKQNNGFYTLISDKDGVILNVYKKDGDLLKKGEALAYMGSGKIIAKLFVAEDDIQRIQLRQPVLITLNTDKNKIYKAVVSKIYPSFDESSQSFFVEATFLEIPTVLKDGTQLQANVIVAEKKNVMVIPAALLLEGDSVMTRIDHKKKAIQVGIKTLEWVEVISGLSDEDVLESPKPQ